MSNDANAGTVTFQLAKVLLNLFLPCLVRPLHRRLRESLLLGSIPTSRRRPQGRDVKPSRGTIATNRPQEGELPREVCTQPSTARPSRRRPGRCDLQMKVITFDLDQDGAGQTCSGAGCHCTVQSCSHKEATLCVITPVSACFIYTVSRSAKNSIWVKSKAGQTSPMTVYADW